ncbi:Uncharacterised protein [Chlamydia trachomatis]|nr:Uncharacterised protein [Chlamydia trachomatis]
MIQETAQKASQDALFVYGGDLGAALFHIEMRRIDYTVDRGPCGQLGASHLPSLYLDQGIAHVHVWELVGHEGQTAHVITTMKRDECMGVYLFHT